jgi:hypothetical protein
MKFHRFAMLHLKPTPKGWGVWKNYIGITDHMIETKMLPVRFDPKAQKGSVLISQGWLVRASLKMKGLPELDENRRVVIPLELREPCETAIEHVANIISVLEGCSRFISSPTPCVAFEYENDEERKFLESSAGIKVDKSSSEFAVRLPIPRDDARLLDALSDRTNGVALLAEAYSGGGESSRYRDFVRFLELAFALPSSQLSKKVFQFLAPAMGYTRQEVQNWMDLRDPHSHADFRKSKFIAVASDVRRFLLRMEQACLDVLFNKAEWMKPTRTRRDVWFPDGISTSPTGGIVLKQGVKSTLRVRIFDEFKVYPRDFGAVLGSFTDKNLYAKIAVG